MNRHTLSGNMHTTLPSRSFINVQLVKYPVPCEEKDIFDIAAIMQTGVAQSKQMQPSSSRVQVTINNSSFTKVENVFDILKPLQGTDKCEPEVILIDGAPGMGKTTLCKEIAYQWAKNQSLADIKLVLFMSLQNLISMIKTLEDFILYFYNFDKTAAEFAKQCASVLLKRNNHDILVILDGYDYTEDSFLTQIVLHKVLGQCKIIITPQSVVTSKLQEIANVRLEILGLSDESKKEIIESKFQNSHSKIELLS